MNKHAPELHRFHAAQGAHCPICGRKSRRKRWVAGISVAAVAGSIIACYVAYERNIVSFERVRLVVDWVVARDSQEKVLHAKLDAIAKRLQEAERRAVAIERLARVCLRELRQQGGAPAVPRAWPFPATR